MNLLQPIRQRRRLLVTQVLGALSAVWLGMVLQPCLMAAEMPMEGDCPHCPEPMPEGCVGATTCSYVDRVDYDGRVPAAKGGSHSPDQSPIALAARPTAIAYQARACATGPPTGIQPHIPTLPLNVLFCVYLN